MDIRISVWNLHIYVAFIVILQCSYQGNSEFHTCDEDAECPEGATCFRDDCARCECPAGQFVTNYITDSKLFKMCIADEIYARLGDSCTEDSWTSPYGSRCDDSLGVWVCKDGLIKNDDLSYCRLADFGERCGHVSCDAELGLECQGHPPLCTCAEAYCSADAWTQYVNHRWEYSSIGIMPRNCVPRSIGDPCSDDAHCAAVQGSGAVCRCDYCQCRVHHHVPDVHGSKCGPALERGATCSMDESEVSVCDGTQGLQCGDECDYYHYTHQLKTCQCSVMHDYKHDMCMPKISGSSCRSDLDCYLLVGGYGVCVNQTCTLADTSTEHLPRVLHRKCHRQKDTTTIPVTTTTAFNQPTNSITENAVLNSTQSKTTILFYKNLHTTLNFSESETTHSNMEKTTAVFNDTIYDERDNSSAQLPTIDIVAPKEYGNISTEETVLVVHGGSSQTGLQTKLHLIVVFIIIMFVT